MGSKVNVPIELKRDWKYACDILTMIKQMLCYSSHFGVIKGFESQNF